MNQFKHIFGLPITLSQTVRSSSISRSAGSNGRDVKRSREISTVSRNNEHYPEPRLTLKSYARLIADYSKSFEVRNTGTECNAGLPGRGMKIVFYPKTPLERFARVSSLITIKNEGTNDGSSLSTNPSEPPVVSPKNIDNGGNIYGILDDTDVLEQVTERADWLDKMVESQKAKRNTKNTSISKDIEEDKRNLAQPLVDNTEKSIFKRSNKVSQNTSDHRSEFLQKIPNTSKGGAKTESFSASTKLVQNNTDVKNEFSIPNFETKKLDSKNDSVTVKPSQESDAVENKFSSGNFGDNAPFVVTVTEESKSSFSSEPPSFHHIDLQINGEPATGVETVTRKVEHFDVISGVEKIEIRIPILSNTGGTIDNESRTSTSTINLCISRRTNESISTGEFENARKIYWDGDSGTKRSRPSSAHSSTSCMSKVKNTRRGKAPRSKVIPWWTTEESFRRSEIASARSSESARLLKTAKTSVPAKVAARGNSQRTDDRDAKEIAISDAKMRMKMVVTKPSNSRQRLRTKRKSLTTISKIIENELLKKSEEKQKNAGQYVLSPGVTKSVAKCETKVKSTASNELKKETSSAIVDGTMLAKTDQAITPTLNKVSKKMLVATQENVKVSGVKSTTTLKTEGEYNKATNDNLSGFSNTKESVYAKPIIIIAKNNNDNETSREIKKSGALVPPKVRSKSRHEVGLKSTTEATPKIPKTYGGARLFPATQTSTGTVTRYSNERVGSLNQNDGVITKKNDTKHSNVKNPTIIIKPIEKKNDGTLIDYGVTVPTRKKSERKLPDSQSTAAVVSKKTSKKEEPVVLATIKEVIPRRYKDFRSSSIYQGIVYPAKLKQTGSGKTEYKMAGLDSAGPKHHPCKARKATSRPKINNFKGSKVSRTSMKIEKNRTGPSEPKSFENTSPEKKLLYSVWLRRTKDTDDHDSKSTKDPRNSEDTR